MEEPMMELPALATGEIAGRASGAKAVMALMAVYRGLASTGRR